MKMCDCGGRFDQDQSRASEILRSDIRPFVLGVGLMDEAVDQVMASYESLPAFERLGREEIRMKIGQYLAKLSSAGHSDTEELAFCGLVYLRILHKGTDPRCAGG
jgi:hypothetical protein